MTSPAPDIVTLVDQIRADVDARRARGEATPEDIDALFDERLGAYIEAAKIDPRLGARLRHESHDWNIDTDYHIRTTRSGMVGALVRAAKTMVRPFVRLYTDHLLNRQAQINLVEWYFLQDSVRRTLHLELEVKRLQHEIDLLKRSR
jgi:hypothetical protein